MRVISGIYKRRRFDVPRTFKARPTTDFAKENLFNVLNNYIDFEEGVSALDLFAGTGSISIELVSRGCDRVISIEKEDRQMPADTRGCIQIHQEQPRAVRFHLCRSPLRFKGTGDNPRTYLPKQFTQRGRLISIGARKGQ